MAMRAGPMPKAHPVYFAIESGGFDHVGMHHAAAEDLDPAEALAVAQVHLDIHLRAGFNEGKYDGPKRTRRVAP